MTEHAPIRVGLGVLVLVLGCPRVDTPGPATKLDDQAGPTDRAVIERPRLAITGCRHLEGSRCHVLSEDQASLHLWIDIEAGATLDVRVDGREVDFDAEPIEGGVGVRIELPAGATALEIEGPAPRWREPFELDFVHERLHPAIVEAKRSASAGSRESHGPLLAVLDELGGYERVDALQLLRRLAARRGAPETLQLTEDTARAAGQIGRMRDVADAAGAAAYMNIERRGFEAGRAWVEQIERVGEQLPEARVWADYYGGLLAYRSGNYAVAIESLGRARHGSRRLALAKFETMASELLLLVLSELGRGEQTRRLSQELLDHAHSNSLACRDRARLLGNVAWAQLMLLDAGLEHVSPGPLLTEELEAVHEQGECPDPETAGFTRVNLALAALAEGEPERAWRWVEAARESPGLPVMLGVWVEELTAQVGLATGRWELLPALVARPMVEGEPSLRWIERVRQAHTLSRFGFEEAALEAHFAGEALLEQTLEDVGIGAGREYYLASKERAQSELVELLIARGQVEQAFCRARLARSRGLRGIDRVAKIEGLSTRDRARREQLLSQYAEIRGALERERAQDWRYAASVRDHLEHRRSERGEQARAMLDEALRMVGEPEGPASCEQLPPIEIGDLTLMQFPRLDSGTWLFAADVGGVTAVPLADAASVTPEAWAAAALTPIAGRIREATRIRVIETSFDASVDYQALAFEGTVLLELAPVVYALDLPTRIHAEPRESEAVVLADPKRDLPHAREEAEVVVETLAAAGWSLHRYEGAEVTRARASEALEGASLVHYAGHGRPGLNGGWDAALTLHEGERIDVSDVLALAQVPEFVVLSGCDTATPPGGLAGGLTLARAFVLAGAHWVIAADGKVDDQLAVELGRELYAKVSSSAQFDGPAALRRAQLALRAAHPSWAWSAYRVLVP